MKMRGHKPQLSDFKLLFVCVHMHACVEVRKQPGVSLSFQESRSPVVQGSGVRGPGVELGSSALHGKCYYLEPKAQVLTPVPSR